MRHGSLFSSKYSSESIGPLRSHGSNSPKSNRSKSSTEFFKGQVLHEQKETESNMEMNNNSTIHIKHDMSTSNEFIKICKVDTLSTDIKHKTPLISLHQSSLPTSRSQDSLSKSPDRSKYLPAPIRHSSSNHSLGGRSPEGPRLSFLNPARSVSLSPSLDSLGKPSRERTPSLLNPDRLSIRPGTGSDLSVSKL